jgi:two-component system, OmpR family, alkaline phosphatase synthesis response regulator PhoP
MKTILIVDDEPKIIHLVRDYLARSNFAVITAATGQEALSVFDHASPDLVVLDLGLQDMDGLDITREIRRKSQIPLIILTARDEESDRILGLELGADDYVTKPFSPKELVARVRAIFRRAEARVAAPQEETIHAGTLVMDFSRRTVKLGEHRIDLTSTEFDLLAIMARQPGRVFTRAQLLDGIHGVSFESYERAIDSHIKNIRRKIESDPTAPKYLVMVYGIGYKFAEEESLKQNPV